MKQGLSNHWLAAILIPFATLVIYHNSYQCPFVFDDLRSLTENVRIRDLAGFFSFKQLLKPRAFVDLSFALNYWFGNLSVSGYHVVNVVIHMATGFMVYFLSLNIFKQLLIPRVQQHTHSNIPKLQVDSRLETYRMEPTTSKEPPDSFQSTIDNHQSSIQWMALLAALIFVAHPIQTQAVTYIIQRYASLAALFYLASVLFYTKARTIAQSSKLKAQNQENPKSHQLTAISLYGLCIICGILAFLSKQNTASLPLAILLVEYLLFDRSWKGWKRKLVWFAPFFVVFGIFLLYVSGFFRGELHFGKLLEDVSALTKETRTVDRWGYLCTQFNVLVIYIRLLFLPIGQNLDYMYPFKTGFLDGYTPVAMLFLLSLVGLGIWSIKKRPVITLGIFWFFITLSVESGIIPISDALFEHRLYLPMFGFALVVAYLVFSLLSARRSWAILISAVIVLSLGTATYLRNRTWHDSIALWSDVISKSKHNYRGYYNLGNAFNAQGRLDEAIRNYFAAVDIRPDYVPVLDNLGVALVHKGRLEEAIRYFEEAERIKPNDAKIQNNFGLALMRQGNVSGAIQHLSKALSIKPNNAKTHSNLGVALAREGRMNEAIREFSRALELMPDDAQVHNNLGMALAGQGRFGEAANHFSEALRIKPDYAVARRNLERSLRYMRKMR